MKLPLYPIDAFANTVFEGNPAAVVPLESWLDNERVLIAGKAVQYLEGTILFK